MHPILSCVGVLEGTGYLLSPVDAAYIEEVNGGTRSMVIN